jgi:hypothetical protein
MLVVLGCQSTPNDFCWLLSLTMDDDDEQLRALLPPH